MIVAHPIASAAVSTTNGIVSCMTPCVSVRKCRCTLELWRDGTHCGVALAQFYGIPMYGQHENTTAKCMFRHRVFLMWEQSAKEQQESGGCGTVISYGSAMPKKPPRDSGIRHWHAPCVRTELYRCFASSMLSISIHDEHLPRPPPYSKPIATGSRHTTDFHHRFISYKERRGIR